ncbi:Anaphase-promoting complex subunit 2 [Acorus calamus]|uniref:Anaphase-promoting complex subunit 2 n=1 Tax=Acorus calamus TaxID=4465 RepID=A0AAV9CNJ6_ACOCL|nr:Anaphase-promoting complex subunit 2 [Acorus calamus]
MEDPGILESLGDESIEEILHSWNDFCACTESLLRGTGSDSAIESEFASSVKSLCRHGLCSLVSDHFFQVLEEDFKRNSVFKFWKNFDAYRDFAATGLDELQMQDWPEKILCKSLEEICTEKLFQEKCLSMLVHALQSREESKGNQKSESEGDILLSRYQLMVSSVLLATLPWHFPEIPRLYFKGKLEELSMMMASEYGDGWDVQFNVKNDSNGNKLSSSFEMDIDGHYQGTTILKNNKLVQNIGDVVRDLRSLGFTSMTEDAYASAIFLLLKNKVCELASDDYRSPVLESIKEWIQAVPLHFLHALIAYLGDSVEYNSVPISYKSPLASHPSCYTGIDVHSEGLVRWKLRLEYFAYETLQDLRIGKLFDIIVDYPESSPAIEDLKQCLEYTGQHSKLVDSFISALRYPLRTIDPTGVFLEAVGEPIRDYLRGRKDTIKCIVTMLTDGNGGNPSGTGNTADSLLEELNKDAENQDNTDCEDDFISDDKQAWINAERWEPDPVEADPSKGSRNRRKVDILGMMVSIIGSKDQLVNEYRVMLAEKLLNKSDYDIDSEIRTLELLKIHFGESSMQRCEIMLNDLIGSKRTNTNIKASTMQPSQRDVMKEDAGFSLDSVDATIISSNFWPPIQAESLNIPEPVEQLLSDYAKRFHEIKTPRKLLWKKNLGTVKLELQFEDRSLQFTVSPVHAAIIMQFQEETSWTSKNLAATIGIPVDTLHRRISFWISKGILVETPGAVANDNNFTLVEELGDANRNGMTGGSCEELLMADEEGEKTVASVEEQLRKEMTVYEMFCVAEPSYDKSLQQLQSFLFELVSEEKLEIKDGLGTDYREDIKHKTNELKGQV